MTGSPDEWYVIFNRDANAGVASSQLETLPTERRKLSYRCESGRLVEGEWTGVSMKALLRRVELPENITHLIIESQDDHRVCIPVSKGLTATLAFDEKRIDGDSPQDVTPRLVGPDIEGPRAVKRIHKISAIHLDPTEDPAGYEQLPE